MYNIVSLYKLTMSKSMLKVKIHNGLNTLYGL